MVLLSRKYDASIGFKKLSTQGHIKEKIANRYRILAWED